VVVKIGVELPKKINLLVRCVDEKSRMYDAVGISLGSFPVSRSTVGCRGIASQSLNARHRHVYLRINAVRTGVTLQSLRLSVVGTWVFGLWEELERLTVRPDASSGCDTTSQCGETLMG
jgi:hypothetical protein